MNASYVQSIGIIQKVYLLGQSHFAGQGESAMDSGKGRWIIAQLCRQAPENRRRPGTGGMRL